jgi:tRNA pseudouridine13 synthase
VKLKARPTDFRVEELLEEGAIHARGEHRVYRVKKEKRTSLEAAAVLAELAGVPAGHVSIAGLKDRQGITTQYMSIPRGKQVSLDGPPLQIESVGFCGRPLDSEMSRGNAFRIVVRELSASDVGRLRGQLDAVREHGLLNYFDEQRFGNLRHQQGWIVLDILRNGPEEGLKRLLTAVSPYDAEKNSQLKSALYRHWGDWRACRDIAGKFGAHHSVFEHLRRSEGDFAGAFRHVASATRLIHLYAFQSHLWNRAVARWVEQALPPRQRTHARSPEGRLVFPLGAIPAPPQWNGAFPLAGARLEGVEDALQRELYEYVLGRLEISPAELAIEGISGFALKSEPRELVLRPRSLRVRPAEPDPLNRGTKLVRLSFELPRGAYATLVVRRLLAGAHEHRGPESRARRPRRE